MRCAYHVRGVGLIAMSRTQAAMSAPPTVSLRPPLPAQRRSRAVRARRVHRAAARARLLRRRRRARCGGPGPRTGAVATVSAQLDRYLSFVAAAQDGAGRCTTGSAPTIGGPTRPVSRTAGAARSGAGARWPPASPARAPQALERFESGARQRSEWSRSMAFAALGAAEILRRRPDHPVAAALLADAAERSATSPTTRLVLARVAAPVRQRRTRRSGDRRRRAAGPSGLARPGPAMLAWLLAVESRGDRSASPRWAAGVAGEPRPGFDQQPIEVAALPTPAPRRSTSPATRAGGRPSTLRGLVPGRQRRRRSACSTR